MEHKNGKMSANKKERERARAKDIVPKMLNIVSKIIDKSTRAHAHTKSKVEQ